MTDVEQVKQAWAVVPLPAALVLMLLAGVADSVVFMLFGGFLYLGAILYRGEDA